ncbi:HmuY protein [Pedobacter terrae]|uniref:HmuY protein n=1 Tax=Pedobacter terrae TaxID=405671 RepID=A0A1G7NPF2_9SPHI|nr:HmuY family protein [Pedobacter terrae]SDF75853.1 HmuY protein [Pedobacter terrae]
MNKLNLMIAFAVVMITFTACKKDSDEPIVVVPPSDGSTLTLNGKTAESNYTNIVYVDFSTDKQIAVDRKSFNIGLTSDGKFRVVLNPSYQTTATATSKTDINAVTLTDPGTTVNLNHDIMDPLTVSLVDYWDGNITKTAFAEVSATESENKVYLLSYEGNKDKDKWFKLKVTRNGSGYKVQYAKLNETVIKTLDVPKSADYNLVFVSLENNKVVQAEPAKSAWDISWSYSTSNSGLGSPYWVQDFVSINNLGGVTAAMVSKKDSYATFVEADLAGITFLSVKDVIGTNWRLTQPSTVNGITMPIGVKSDTFFLIKDGSGNVYKLKFNSFTSNDGGTRGMPVIEYKLVKKGSI